MMKMSIVMIGEIAKRKRMIRLLLGLLALFLVGISPVLCAIVKEYFQGK